MIYDIILFIIVGTPSRSGLSSGAVAAIVIVIILVAVALAIAAIIIVIVVLKYLKGCDIPTYTYVRGGFLRPS